MYQFFFFIEEWGFGKALIYLYLCRMKFNDVKCIVTDIEGTTTSVKFVYDVLFPYFRENISKLRDMTANPEVQAAFKKTVELAASLENKKLSSVDDVIETLTKWSIEDRKITPLKTLQGILWEQGYTDGSIKGHVYDDVKLNLQKWNDQNIQLAVFSSGSVTAQILLFKHSNEGDLSVFFSNYFDTTTGGKREEETYVKIAEAMAVKPEEILFLSDIVEELQAADAKNLQTVQLVRPGTVAAWKNTAGSFNDIEII